MFELSKRLKLNLLRALLSEKELFGSSDDGENIIRFLDDMMDLKSLPSTDSRYKDAYGDTYQHLVNNYDWEYEWVLTERFNIIDNNETFIEFLNRIIHPDLRKNEDDITKYYLLINPYLEKENLALKAIQLDTNGLRVYEVTSKKEADKTPIDIVQNNIPFFVDNYPRGFFDDVATFKKSGFDACFVLDPNKGWNDYGVWSTFTLYYRSVDTEVITIGYPKIIHETESHTFDVLDKQFKVLGNQFCSLGQELDYYENLKRIFGNKFLNILWALQDSAFFPPILERFEHNSNFKNSLIRFNEPERLLREAKYELYGFNLDNLYSFKYAFKPNFTDDELEIDFDFSSDSLIPNRIYAIIGKNGTGKTQLVTTLPLDIANKKNDNFTPKAPLFSKVITVSYSSFDRFQIPKKTAEFNYVYCGLKDENGNRLEEDQLILRFNDSYSKIIEQQRDSNYIKIINQFIDIDILKQFISKKAGAYEINSSKFVATIRQLSSGQSILLYIITEIVANIRFDSLLIYDEPETHLHPNAISQLINTIYELTNEFQSYCIIATHSPLIVQELLSKNVYIIEKESNVITARKPLIETFGENLTTITEEIFGNRDIPNHFEKILTGLAETGKSFDEILTLIESKGIPLSLNARIYLKSIVDEES